MVLDVEHKKSENDVLNSFIKKFRYLKGLYFPQVPIGLKRLEKAPPKYVIDLVRVDSSEYKVYPRIQRKYWERAMEGDPIYKELNFNGKNIWLIEGKVVARYDSIGQILVYRDLFLEDWPKAKILVLGIVACSFETGVKEECAKQRIKVWELGGC